MVTGYQKYIPFQPVRLPDRQWPERAIDKASVWYSVDLRNGNQALVDPTNLDEKLLFFQILVDIGFKEIEVGFPFASEMEYEMLCTLIDQNLIPDDVTVQVSVQARPHLIHKAFEVISGAKNVIVHFYNSTLTLQRKVVLNTDMNGIADIAVKGAKLIRELIEEEVKRSGANIRYEYLPESFTSTEMDNAVRIYEHVLDELGATPEKPVILNLPNTVEGSTPNCYADQIEYFCRNLKGRDRTIISIHPHNDRGCAVAVIELGMMAGAEHVEGTIFGNGERTGNTDVTAVVMNMYAQGVDLGLSFTEMNKTHEVYESCTRMKVHEWHPYAGELVFTVFSGSHQDTIKKGVDYIQESHSPVWQVPYLSIDPADVGYEYEPITRINSQSDKGGAAFIMQQMFGYNLPKEMYPEFGMVVQTACDNLGHELQPQEIFSLFQKEYLQIRYPYNLKSYKLYEENEDDGETTVHFEGVLRFHHEDHQTSGVGSDPVDASFKALGGVGIEDCRSVSYHEHAVSKGTDSKALSYIRLTTLDYRTVFGVGLDNNTSLASIKGTVCVINRAQLSAVGNDL